jgi:disulfide bond formation protein DsbB
MDAAGALATISQLAMAVTGFAGLLAAFRSRRRRWLEIEVVALHFLLLASISACLLGLLPLVLETAASEASPAWRFCQLLLGGWLLFLFAWQYQKGWRKGLRPRRPSINAAMWLAGFGLALGNIAASARLIDALTPAVIYLAGLFWLLLGAILQFVVQVVHSLDPADEA